MIKLTKQEVETLYIENGYTDGHFAVFNCDGSSLGLGFTGSISFSIYDNGVFVIEINDQAYKTESRDEAIKFYSDFIYENALYLKYLVTDGASDGYLYQAEGSDEDEITIYKSSVNEYWVLSPSDVNEEYLSELRARINCEEMRSFDVHSFDMQDYLESVVKTELTSFSNAFLSLTV